MPGMIGAGTGYERNALSGFARLSAQEQERQTANKQLDEAQKQQEISMGASAASLIAMIAINAM